MEDDKKYTTISIPVQLNEKVKEKIRGTGFHSVSSYVAYVLRQIVTETSQDPKKEPDKAFSKEEEEKVKDRLRGLGYLE